MSHRIGRRQWICKKNRGRHRRMPIKNTGRRKSHVAKIECKTGRFLRVWRTQHLSNKRPHTKNNAHLAPGLLVKSFTNFHEARNSFGCRQFGENELLPLLLYRYFKIYLKYEIFKFEIVFLCVSLFIMFLSPARFNITRARVISHGNFIQH